MVPALALYKRVCTASFCELEIKKSKVSEYQSAPLQLYFTANDIPDARKKSVFLSALGYETYDILANVYDDPEAQTFDTLVERLTNHFHPKSSVVAERYKFGCRRQGDSESIADFVADLRSLAARCKFKAAALDETLRDRFVCGLSKEFIRSRLLTEQDNLLFDRAVEIAMTLEDARQTAHLMQQREVPVHHSEVAVGKSRKHSSGQTSCYRCGGSHSSSACRFLKEKCHSCGKLGHIAKVCRSSKAKDTKAKSQPKAQRTAPKSTHVIAEGPVHSPILEDSEDVFMIPSLTSRVAPIPVTVIANGQPLEMELDTGAAVSLISEDTYKAKFKDSVALKSSDITLRSYSGHFLTVMGTADLEITYKDQKSTLH